MQAVILAAGESSRFWPLNQKHKSLFEIMGKPLIFYKVKKLFDIGVKEIIIVQKPNLEIEKEFENYSFPFKNKIRFLVQEKSEGTGQALKVAEKFLKEKVLVLNGDDFYLAEDIKKCFSKFPSLLVKEVEKPTLFGTIIAKKNIVKEIAEKSEKPSSNLVNAGCYFIPSKILKERIERSIRGEYEITDYLRILAKKEKLYFFKAREWFPLSFAWDLFPINEYLLKNIKTEIKGKIEKNCQIKKPVIIKEGAIIKSGSYIEGPVYIGRNCQVGPNCYIRPFTTIEDNCLIGQGVEVKNSIIGEGSKISHLSYVGDSIIGKNCNLGAGVVLANLRFDGEIIKSTVKGRLIKTDRKKFGSVIGDNSKIGVNNSIMPGVLIGSNCLIDPHSLVKENIKDNHIFYSQHQTSIKEKNK